jgi:hypothetical protein
VVVVSVARKSEHVEQGASACRCATLVHAQDKFVNGTHSAMALPLREIVLASTTKTTAFASNIWSRN